MKISLQRAYVTKGSTLDDGILDIEGMGEVKIQKPLPQEIIKQIEDFYANEFRNKFLSTNGGSSL